MKLTKATVENFKSIEKSGDVPIDPSVTVLVGQNESGKTAFLEALNKARSAASDVKFDVVQDYPRRWLQRYQEDEDLQPARVVTLEYALEDLDLERINDSAGLDLLSELSFTLTHKYNNRYIIGLTLDEEPYVQHRVKEAALTTEVRQQAAKATTIIELIDILKEATLNADEEELRDDLVDTFGEHRRWPNNRVLAPYIFDRLIEPYIPKFVYFDEYYLLPGKINLKDLRARLDEDVPSKPLRDEDRTAQSLLKLAGISLESLASGSGYEANRAKLESTGITITDKLFNYWKQNESLEVEFDIRPDPVDEPPFNDGDNLYIRIYNRRHRVTVPFSQRSKGFIWFFSFIAWFDSIRKDLKKGEQLILLLDEPGLSLHALAQHDFLNYIDYLSKHHQIIYTTHSPFMVQSDRLHQARTVEDKDDQGTKVSDKVSASDPATLFPLQAAVGYTIAQNLFIGKRNLLVEGTSDLVYLQFMSGLLESVGREGLREDIVITPVGGVDKVSTFVALIGANQLELAILSDYVGQPDQHIQNLIKEKLIHQRKVRNYAEFRGRSGGHLVATDVEDLFTPATYLKLFNGAYANHLGGRKIKPSELPAGDRIVVRLSQFLDVEGIQVRPSGGYNHHLPANYLASHSLTAQQIGDRTLDTFEELFQSVNKLYSDEN